MPTVKEHVRDLLEDLPDHATWKELRHEIIMREESEKDFPETGESEHGFEDNVEASLPLTVGEHVRNLLEDLPKNISWEQFEFELAAFRRYLVAVQEIETGNTIPHEEVMKELLNWSTKSSGPMPRKKKQRPFASSQKHTPTSVASESPGKYQRKSK